MELEDLPNNPSPIPAQIVVVRQEDGSLMMGVKGTPQERTELLMALMSKAPELASDMAAALGAYAQQGINLESAVGNQAKKIVELQRECQQRDRKEYLSQN